MNNNDEYIKMILALPEEFFKGWEWKTGDHIINVLNNRTLVFLWKTETYAWYYNYHPSFSNEVGSSIKLCEIRPLPSQEQLQKMCGKLDTEFKDWQTFYFELCAGVGCSYSVDPRDIRFNKFDSVEKAGLALAVELSLDKYWNGISWVTE